jgi:hypothetical protein
MGAYEALVNSGGLMLIRDESLRAALAGFAARVSGEYAESWSTQNYFAFVRDYGASFVLQAWRRENGAMDASALAATVRSERFQEHLALRYYSERDIANKYRALLDQAQSVLAQLDAQLQR